MSSGQSLQAARPSPAEYPELEAGRKSLVRSRMLGKLSACIFLLAALAVVDGLQTLMRHEFNEISLIPGETVVMSGMMPQNATTHGDLIVEMEGLSGLTFTPTDSFKGFWMGGNMWRADLTASATAAPGKGSLTVVDMVPLKKVGKAVLHDEDSPRGQVAAPADPSGGNGTEDSEGKGAETIIGQNPTLVYSVVIWPTPADLQAAEHSFIRRFTGIAPFAAAAAAAGLAFLFGIANFIFFARAEARLAAHCIYFIHGIKAQADGSLHASFAHAGKNEFSAGDPVILYDTRWREHGRGVIVNKDRFKGFAGFSPQTPPRYGWLVAIVPENAQAAAAG